MSRVALAVFGLLFLNACSSEVEPAAPQEVLALGPADFSVAAQGELKAAKATSLMVPGTQWSQRQLVWMAADGSVVKAGDIVARFGAEQTKLELDKALLDLERNALSRAAKEAELDVGSGRLDVDLAQVQSDLAIAQRYAQADFEAIARNVVLDAVADERFLGEKREVLDWRQGQTAERGGAELNVLAAQRSTVATNVDTRKADLAALELRAPHDGVFVLDADWSGEKPQLGAQMWAGNDFASLPDTSALEVELSLPQIESQGLAVGQRVLLQPMGQPEKQFESTISWVASAPRAASRQSPVKFLAFKARVPAELATREQWVPGQAFAARVVMKQSDEALTVPNLALRSEGDALYVQVLVDGEPQRRSVTLGVRGPARSEVTEGLQAGDTVLLTSESSAASSATEEATPERRRGRPERGA